MEYMREGRGTWHVAVPDTDTGLTLCRRFPVERWDQVTTERPSARVCPGCQELASTAL